MTAHRPRDGSTSRPRFRGGRLLAGLVAGLILLAAGAYAASRSGALPQIWDWQRDAYQTTGPAATLVDLTATDQLATLFNEHEGVPRLVVLLSPT
ncbi:MAG: hypothetical protein M3252_05220 [Actinomycetota bacterium]|nr:hypothetical protein [Actinomycetota bacterium]